MEQHDERYYNTRKLNLLFAIASVLLFLSLVLLLKDDFSRSWKDYQREFQALEIEKTNEKYGGVVNTLKDSQEYQDLQKQLTQAQEEFNVNCPDLDQADKKQGKLKARNDILNQKYRVTKAEFDTAKFNYEDTLGKHHGNLAKAQKRYEQLGKEVDELKTAIEGSDKDIKDQSQMREQCEQHLKVLKKKERDLTKQSTILERKLKKIDPKAMSLLNRVATMVRDLPIIDLANPNYKIDQIVLKNITDDVNFMRVPKADRCITCHKGIINPDYKDAAQPFTTHPNLELYLDKDSPHPMEEYGCTSCHGGRGRGTDFTSTAHTPSSDEQKKEWKEKYDWHALHHWENPMRPMQYVEASCFTCHTHETIIKGSEKLNLALTLIERASCYRCHPLERYMDWPKLGPSLTHLDSKVTKEWTYRWLQSPQSFRHNTWMPAFFGQSNDSDPESTAQIQQWIHAITHYLFAESEEFKLEKMPFTGDAKKGEKLVASIGCLGCHAIQHEKSSAPRTRNTLRREQGPNLIGLGTKTSQAWLYNWLKNPHRYHSETRMPNLRLTSQEASDITAYLAQDKNVAFDQKTIPSVDEKILDQSVEGFMRKSQTQAQARASITKMGLPDKLHYLGKKLIGHYGCFSCHEIQGFENYKPIATELTEEGSKPVARLDFGFSDIEHTRHAFFAQKLKEPRIFDKDKIKALDEKLIMPNYYFSDTEVEAIVTALLGFVQKKPSPASRKPRTTKNLFIEAGQRLVRQSNCQGCHVMEGEGGAIQPKVIDWLVKYDNRSLEEAKAVVKSFSPPDLVGEGQKVHAQWLFNFLHEPITIRPWLKTRMPNYGFNAEDLNTFVKYFNALDDQDFPFTAVHEGKRIPEEYEAGKKLFSADYFDCAKCHIVGDKMPGGSPDSWAPDFALSKERLKPDWLIQWMIDPQNLLPGTKMPTFFDPEYFDVSGPDDIMDGDEHEQIRVLRDYLLTLSEQPSPTPTPPVPAPPSAVAAPQASDDTQEPTPEN